MKALTLRLNDEQHAEIIRRAAVAGLSVADYIRQAALGDDLASLVREIHAALCPVPTAGLGREAADALAALVQTGLAARQARAAVEQILQANPKVGAAEIIRQVLARG